MLRHQDRVFVTREAISAGIRAARWPARLQRLAPGPLTALARRHDVWLDGGHNPDAGEAIARFFAGQPVHLVIGMLASKDAGAIVTPLTGRLASVSAVPVPGHDAHGPDAFTSAESRPSVAAALAVLPDDGLPVLIAGSLYLAGEVLRLNEEFPD